MGWQIFGVEFGSTVCPTRLHDWTVVRQSAQADNERSGPIAKRRDATSLRRRRGGRAGCPAGAYAPTTRRDDTLHFTDAI